MKYFLDAVQRNYCNFSGRLSVKGYWMFVLFNFIFTAILYALVLVAGKFFYALYGLYALGILLPGLGAVVRRLHDTGRGGGWIFIALVPAIGTIWLLVLLCLESEPANRFGEPNPVE